MIRRAGADDVDAIARVFRRSFATLDFLPTLHTPEEEREHLRRVVVEQDVWVAVRGSRVVGFTALDGDLGTFLYVDPEAHGGGIGSALLEEVMRARPDGFRFWAFQENAKARAFYERRGCRAVEFTDGRGNEEKAPDVLYEWRPEPAGES
jgi:GNAT superfamily N-acetyltransferase